MEGSSELGQTWASLEHPWSIPGTSLEHPCTWVGEVKGSGPTDSWAAPRARWGPGADTPPPLSAPQPDLGAGGWEGQLLAVLHHGDGRRHEHLGCQGEVSPRCHGPPRLGPPSIEPSLATALIAVPQRAAVQLLAMVVDPILPTGVPHSWVWWISFNPGPGEGTTLGGTVTAHHQRGGLTPALRRDPAPSPGFGFAHMT